MESEFCFQFISIGRGELLLSDGWDAIWCGAGRGPGNQPSGVSSALLSVNKV